MQVKDRNASTVTQRVYMRLKHQIINRDFEPGHHLVINRVAAQLGTSLTPVRETLRLLEKDGLVETTPHKGTVVLTPNRKQFEDIFHVRAVTEGLATKMACMWLTADDLKKLGETLDRGRQSVANDDNTGWIEADEQFHMLISRKYGNAFLDRILAGIFEHVHIFREMTADPSGIATMSTAVEEHEAILAALNERDAAKAEQMMIIHIENALRVGLGIIAMKD